MLKFASRLFLFAKANKNSKLILKCARMAQAGGVNCYISLMPVDF